MSTIVTRSGKGSPLTNTEVDANFTNLNTDKLEISGGTMTGDLSFGDNDKAIFGAGSDLQIYHTGSASRIQDTGTGNLYIAGTHLQLTDATITDNYLQAVSGGAVTIYHSGDGKLATTSTGINVTGTLNVDNSTTNGFLSAGSNILNFGTSSNDTLAFYANNTNHMKLKPDGEVIINETGSAEGDLRVESDSVSHMLFVDAGNNRVGIGKSDPARTLDVHGSVEISVNTASHETFLFTTQAANDAKLMMQNASASTAVQLSANGTTFFNGGNVGVGTVNPVSSGQSTITIVLRTIRGKTV